MLHAIECWAPTKANIDRLNRSDRAMLRWICKVKLSDRVATSALLKKLNLLEIENEMRASRLGWYGHVHRSGNWINLITSLEVSGFAPRGRPKKTWSQTIAEDKRKWKIERADPSDRNGWKQCVRQAIKQRRPVQPAEQPWNR